MHRKVTAEVLEDCAVLELAEPTSEPGQASEEEDEQWRSRLLYATAAGAGEAVADVLSRGRTWRETRTTHPQFPK